jgi:hypothetical protein
MRRGEERRGEERRRGSFKKACKKQKKVGRSQIQQSGV